MDDVSTAARAPTAKGPRLASVYNVQFVLQGERCFYCRVKLLNRAAPRHGEPGWTEDHVIPKCRGGKRAGNILLACRACNEAKADMHPKPEWVAAAMDLWERAKAIHARWHPVHTKYPRRQRRERLLEMIYDQAPQGS